MREDEQMGKSGTIEGTLKGSNVNSHGLQPIDGENGKRLTTPMDRAISDLRMRV